MLKKLKSQMRQIARDGRRTMDRLAGATDLRARKRGLRPLLTAVLPRTKDRCTALPTAELLSLHKLQKSSSQRIP